MIEHVIDFSDTAGGDLTAALSAYADAVDALLNIDFDTTTPPELVDFLRGWETQQRRTAAVTHGAVAALGTSGAPGEFGYRDPGALLADVLHLTPGEARARWRTADDLGPRRTLLGEALPPQFEHIARAQRDGILSPAHATVIIKALDALSPEVDCDTADEVQRELVAHAAHLDSKKLGTAATYLLAHVDPDGQKPLDAEQQRRRTLTLAASPDGSGHLPARLTPELLALLKTVLDPLAAPVPATDGTPDPRTPGQRTHDALLDLCHRALRDGGLPASGGVPATLILIAHERDFRRQQGFATTAHGGLIPMADAHRLADQADIYTVTLADTGGILDYGRERRVAPPSQRIPIWARDRGCTFPGCTIPPPWTQLHHFQSWIDNGPTSINNQGLLCGYHHRNHQHMGWTGIMINNTPHWIPPPHIDPQQKPLQNQYWKAPDIRA